MELVQRGRVGRLGGILARGCHRLMCELVAVGVSIGMAIA